MTFIVCRHGQKARQERERCGKTYVPKVAIAPALLEGQVCVDGSVEVVQLNVVQAFEDALGVDGRQFLVIVVAVVAVACGVQGAQGDGKKVDGLCSTSACSDDGLLLCLLEHKSVFIGHPCFLLGVGC